MCLFFFFFFVFSVVGQTAPRSGLAAVEMIIHKEEKEDIEEMDEMHAEEVIIEGM